MRPETTDFLKQARADFETATRNIGIDCFYASVFFSQQAAEKALKALHIERLREIPKTHNLLELGRALGLGEDQLAAARELNPEYVVTRCPDAANGVPAEMYDKRSAEVHLECARSILTFVETELSSGS